MIDLTVAQTFFDTHLLVDCWLLANDARKSAALTMACADVKLALDGISVDQDNSQHIGAVCEQAIFLLRHNGDAPGSLSDVLKAETVDGVGSAVYRSTQGINLAPRARMYVDHIRSTLGTVRFNRA